MKKNLIFLVFIVIAVLKCESYSPEISGSKTMDYLSFEEYGCIAERDSIDEPYWAWAIINDSLKFKVMFNTHCSALFKDSVHIDNYKIRVFLQDTNSIVSRCVCRHETMFVFRIKSAGRHDLQFYYKAANSYVYSEIFSANIQIEKCIF
ncbi:hypothetical protein MROS_2778 [Melioribacter roseus P3M-2]|uniref:Uncharacterized protein n=1 Tax=Melioribacter roseus (strain DSM 23840 / JCM 17771 / VKM B-2668 / P3M-2) TaxID=1191523 RepID=I7A474_MELRP|nr:hypothetical protein [Melioribacter roseus]AFN76008.1 hypothetical protein MROS_2778 [Melioribacter roseus P3M-2]